MAALQEPTLLRAYGIRMPHQAAAVVGAAMLVVLLARLPRSRLVSTQVVVSNTLATLCVGAAAVFLVLAEVAFGRFGAAIDVLGWFVGTAIATYPFAIVLGAPDGAAASVRAVATAAAAAAFVVLAVRFDAGNWSSSTLAATLLASLAASFHARASAASSHAHRHPR